MDILSELGPSAIVSTLAMLPAILGHMGAPDFFVTLVSCSVFELDDDLRASLLCSDNSRLFAASPMRLKHPIMIGSTLDVDFGVSLYSDLVLQLRIKHNSLFTPSHHATARLFISRHLTVVFMGTNIADLVSGPQEQARLYEFS